MRRNKNASETETAARRLTESALFESTLPFGTPDLMRVSAFQRYLEELEREDARSSTRMSALSPSLMQDLMRFERGEGAGEGPDLIEVLAAAVRHARNLLIHLQNSDRVLPLSVFPVERLAHCPLRIDQLLAGPLDGLTVLHVEPAVLRPPGDRERTLVGEAELYTPLAPLLWQLALRGGRDELLPEIAGSTAYRVAPGLDLRGLPMNNALAAAILRLQRQTTNLREIAEWPGLDRPLAMRLLNGLYLQAGLIVSHAHPAATNESWFSGGR